MPPEIVRAVLKAIATLVKQDVSPYRDCIDGCRIAPRPMSPKERGQQTLPAANAKRAALREERRSGILSTLRAIITENPALSPNELAATLNRRKIRTASGKAWTARTVRETLKETT